MDQHNTNEISKLSHEITKLITRVDYHEKEIAENNRANEGRFLKIEDKIDALSKALTDEIKELTASVSNVGKDVAVLIGKSALVISALFGVLGAVGKSLGWW